jgi:hypothetical protein
MKESVLIMTSGNYDMSELIMTLTSESGQNIFWNSKSKFDVRIQFKYDMAELVITVLSALSVTFFR